MSEIQVYQQPSAIMPVMDIQQAVARRDAMKHFVQGIMTQGTDYGKVPGTDKNTLLKPGAEKLSTFFGLTAQFVIVKEQEAWGDYETPPFFYYWYKCQLYHGDRLVGEGDGSCNSHESKYRWRWVSEDDIPPGLNQAVLKTRGGTISEFGFAVDKAETGGKYGKPAEYWQQFKDAISNGSARSIQKATRKGAQYDAWEIDSTVYRIPNDDAASQANTILKMAQKRAMVAAVLVTVNASEYFTQDLEDFDPSDIVQGTVVSTTTAPPTTKPTDKPAKKQSANGHTSYPPVDPSKWDELPVPVDFTEIYARAPQLHITGDTPEGQRKHTANIIALGHPARKATPASAWQTLLHHQRSKLSGTADDVDSYVWTQEEIARLLNETRNSYTIPDADTFKALGVPQISDYPGDYDAAIADIDQWIAKQAELAEAVDELYGEGAEAV